MQFRKSTQEDMAYVRANPFEVAVKGYHDMTVPDDNTFTAIFESEIVGMGGIVIRWPGYCLCWLMLTSDCKKRGVYGIAALGAIHEKLNDLLDENNIIRAECAVRPEFGAAIKMVEYMGFEREGLMRHQMPDGGDGILYARITI